MPRRNVSDDTALIKRFLEMNLFDRVTSCDLPSVVLSFFFGLCSLKNEAGAARVFTEVLQN